MSRRLSHHSEEKRPSREDYMSVPRPPHRSSRQQSPRNERSRSPRRSHKHRHHHAHHAHHKRKRSPPKRPVTLPYDAQPISKHDFKSLRPVFALYLDVQKQLLLDELPDDEGRGRWKSFVGRWNRGELAEGWYDPSTIQKAMESESTNDAAREASSRRRDSPDYGAEMPATKPMGNQNQNNDGDDDDDEDDDDVVGPTLPGQESRSRRTGPAVPTLQDLELRREADHESESEARESLRQDRALDRKTQRERLDELVPRADAGTRERQLEKKRALTDKLRSYRDKSPVEEVRDAELLGADEDDDRGGGGTLEGFKKRKKEMERKKNDRELRREEVLRARAEEREERMRIHKAKEDKTLTMLKSLAKQNFG